MKITYSVKEHERDVFCYNLASAQHVKHRLATHVCSVDDVILSTRVASSDSLGGGDGEGGDVANEFFRCKCLLNAIRRHVRLQEQHTHDVTTVTHVTSHVRAHRY